MQTFTKLSIVLAASWLSFSAAAAPVTCTASCVLGEGTRVVTVQSRGVDAQDAVLDLGANCKREAQAIKSATHYLATSFQKPTSQFTTLVTEFDVTKACF